LQQQQALSCARGLRQAPVHEGGGKAWLLKFKKKNNTKKKKKKKEPRELSWIESEN
jgi:hypothetical protein